MFALSPDSLFLLRVAAVGVLGFTVFVSYAKCLEVVQDAARARGEPEEINLGVGGLMVLLGALGEPRGFWSAVTCIIAEAALAGLVYNWVFK